MPSNIKPVSGGYATLPSLTIRYANPTDKAIVAGFVYNLLNEISGGHAPARDVILTTTDVVLAHKDVTVFLAFMDEQPVGLMTLNSCIAIYAGGQFGEISELYIKPDMRSRGIAAHLIARAVIEGRSRGWKRLEVGAPLFRRARAASLSIATMGLRKLDRGSAWYCDRLPHVRNAGSRRMTHARSVIDPVRDGRMLVKQALFISA